MITIKEVISTYRENLCDEEVMLAKTYYEYTQNINKTILICEDLKKAAYGLAHNKADISAINHINERIARDVILKLIGKSDSYFDKLPIDTQDELIDCYEQYSQEDELKENLYKILELTPAEHKIIESEIIHSAKPDTVDIKENKKESLLGKLKMYQKIVQKRHSNNGG